MQPVKQRILTSTVLVAGLGYFVDIYDLLLFGIVRVASLKGIGLPESDFLSVGIRLVNLQMIGMLVGGILWGIVGDKKGRVSVLFGSIMIYSVANILNAFVTTVPAYGFLRFVAGLGLAGELGAAITLVSETLSKEHRGLGTSLVAGIGISGAVCAGIVGSLFDWRTCYFIGGAMGLVLLVMRLSILESGMYKSTQEKNVRKGDFRMLFYPASRFFRYLRCILIGIPIWFTIGIVITFSPELAKEMKVDGVVTAGTAIMFCYLGGSLGNMTCGILSQVWKSRKKATLVFLTMLLSLIAIHLFTVGQSLVVFYSFCTVLGFATGYWVVFMTIAAEQFGTNLRATVTTTVPNFVRASVVVLTFAFQALKGPFGLIQSAWIVGLTSIAIAVGSLYFMKETFGKELDFAELETV